MPSVEGVRCWYARAEEHLREFNVIREGVLEDERKRIRSSFQVENHPDLGPIYSVHPEPESGSLPSNASVLIGEVIQALRRCLDYLVFEIAFLDSGVEQNDTQFPCDGSPKTFWNRLHRNKRGAHDHTCYLIGVDSKHAAVIEEFQPYKGVGWWKRLVDLSNPDKHRRLTVTTNRGEARMVFMPDPPATSEPEDMPNGVSFVIPRAENDAGYLKFLVTVQVNFDDGSDVLQVLQELMTEVARAVEKFVPCFDGQCVH